MEMTIEQEVRLRIEKRSPTREEYQSLGSQSDWNTVENQFEKIAFGKEVYSVVVLDGLNMVGMGRVIGDGAIYFNIQDLMVHPAYNSKKVGGLVMDNIEGYFKTIASRHAYIGLTVTSGTKEFYKKYGFVQRKSKSLEMFKIVIRHS
nr:GNAT family N-acetyltransferase [Allomuricauda sp.]